MHSNVITLCFQAPSDTDDAIISSTHSSNADGVQSIPSLSSMPELNTLSTQSSSEHGESGDNTVTEQSTVVTEPPQINLPDGDEFTKVQYSTTHIIISPCYYG